MEYLIGILLIIVIIELKMTMVKLNDIEAYFIDKEDH